MDVLTLAIAKQYTDKQIENITVGSSGLVVTDDDEGNVVIDNVISEENSL